MGTGWLARRDQSYDLGVPATAAITGADSRMLARQAGFAYKRQDYGQSYHRRKMVNVAEGVVLGVGLMGGMYRAGEAQVAMNPGVAPYIQNLMQAGNVGLVGIVYDIADS